jgi:hypothetical protein
VSAQATTPLRTVAFGDLNADVWGVLCGYAEPLLALGTTALGASLDAAPTSIAGIEAGEEWTISGPDLELTVSPDSEAAISQSIDGFDQLCRVHGDALIGGARHELDLRGRRAVRAGLDLGGFQSIRDVCAWFGPVDGIAVTSLRPWGAKGHDRDVIEASVFDPAGAAAVADPRLSTTYSGDGQPSRVGLELWLRQDESDEQYPRRAAGEALGARAAWAQSTVELRAYTLRCHSRSEEGFGVYLLARSK